LFEMLILALIILIIILIAYTGMLIRAHRAVIAGLRDKNYGGSFYPCAAFAALSDLCIIGILFIAVTTVAAEYSRNTYWKHKPTEFFKVEEALGMRDGSYDVYEHFVISNPPKDSALLKKMIEEYNFQTIPLDTLNRYGAYHRYFYRETGCFTRNYEDGEPYPKPYWWGWQCHVDYGYDFKDYGIGQNLIHRHAKMIASAEYNYSAARGFRGTDPSCGRWFYIYEDQQRNGLERFHINDICAYYKENSAVRLEAAKGGGWKTGTRKPAAPWTQGSQFNPNIAYDSLVYERQTYRTVRIGDLTWMAENLNFKTGNSWCYNLNESYCQKYGRLYDWNDAMQACPAGWRLPDDDDWRNLILDAGYDKANENLKSKTGWRNFIDFDYGIFFWQHEKIRSGSGTDEFGFSALPGGGRYHHRNGGFEHARYWGCWWSATEIDADTASVHKIHGYRLDGYGPVPVNISKRDGLSVRCVRDGE